jgi:hypothetical protein
MKAKRKPIGVEAPDVSTALEVARWLWPEFKRVGDGTFFGSTHLTPEDLTPQELGAGRDLLGEEAFQTTPTCSTSSLTAPTT